MQEYWWKGKTCFTSGSEVAPVREVWDTKFSRLMVVPGVNRAEEEASAAHSERTILENN